VRGRKPLPSWRKRLEGNPGKRPLNKQEPQPPDLIWETPPPEVAADLNAAAEWRRLVPMLRKGRQVSDADRAALMALCLEWAKYLEATDKVRVAGLVVKTPTGYPMQNPYLSIARQALAACNRLWPELGLTPSSRSRVKTTAEDVLDVFTEFDAPPLRPQ
jgi:P27 family predicted phage terminase small subunit